MAIDRARGLARKGGGLLSRRSRVQIPAGPPSVRKLLEIYHRLIKATPHL